jgi:hypothetical protein
MESIPSTVRGSLPVLFFGDAFASSVATVGINPSRQEYLSKEGEELTGSLRRFETLGSLAAESRASLTDLQADTAIQRMRRYFNPESPVYGWFGGLSRVVEGMGMSFRDRSAAHLDLVQEATDPVWSQLMKADPEQAAKVLRRDLPFLLRQIEEFQLRVVICTSARVHNEISQLLEVQAIRSGNLARLRWTVGTATLTREVVAVAGWNIPLARPTGLNRDGQRHLGRLLRTELRQCGIDTG